ncbi:putative nucleotidyltransferase [Thalassobacillus pellis]|nr:putative nucleotidyltransferase [Thalassobacillus pellis]
MSKYKERQRLVEAVLAAEELTLDVAKVNASSFCRSITDIDAEENAVNALIWVVPREQSFSSHTLG